MPRHFRPALRVSRVWVRGEAVRVISITSSPGLAASSSGGGRGPSGESQRPDIAASVPEHPFGLPAADR